ncbi:hypothetical protein [Aquimarina megaterium]|uniref:hypothetical protein n=1 Tax=Aquimarina megaterium TaxID=1443666 RepID=UPI00046F9E66|nr:hypothetical protein [Aquimarina megaterium]
MRIELSIVNILEILSIGTAAIFGLFFILNNTKNNRANIFLGLFLWSLATEVLSTFFERIEFNKFNFSFIGQITLPFLFLYIIGTLNYKVKKEYIFLLIFPLVFKLLNFNTIYVFHIYDITLLVFTLIIINKHNQKLNSFHSNIENKTLNWMKAIVYIYLFFYSFWVIEDLVSLVSKEVIKYFAFGSSIMTLLMIYWVGYKGFSQPEIFTSKINLKNNKEEIIAITKETSSKKNTENEFSHLIKIIQKEKLFLNAEINLYILSKQLNVTERKLSELIKIHTNKNFYQFMNQFRVEEFKSLILTKKN